MKNLFFIFLAIFIFFDSGAKGGKFNTYVKENLDKIPDSTKKADCKKSPKSCKDEFFYKYALLTSYENSFGSLSPALEKNVMTEINAWDHYIHAYLREIFIYDRPFDTTDTVRENQAFLIEFLKERRKIIDALKDKHLNYETTDVDLTVKNGVRTLTKVQVGRELYVASRKKFPADGKMSKSDPRYACIKTSETPYDDDFLKTTCCSVYEAFGELIAKFKQHPKILITFTKGQVAWEKYINAHYNLLTQLGDYPKGSDLIKARIFFLMKDRRKFLKDWADYYGVAVSKGAQNLSLKLTAQDKKAMCDKRTPRYVSAPVACQPNSRS